jgi:hypothetical protein
MVRTRRAQILFTKLLLPSAACAFVLRATLVVSERGLSISTLRPLLSFLLWHHFLDGLLSSFSNGLGGLHNARLVTVFFFAFLAIRSSFSVSKLGLQKLFVAFANSLVGAAT